MDWLSLLLVTMIVALTYLQSMHGMVSTIIMCVTTLICVPVAFALYEWLAAAWLADLIGDLGLPVAFMASFLVPLVIIRLSLDALIKRENLLPIVIDRAGAAVISFISSYLLAGMVAIAVFMTPFGGTFMGRTFINLKDGNVNHVWLGPETFTVNYASAMSTGLFQGTTPYTLDHPDPLREYAMANACRNEIRHWAPPGSVDFIRASTSQYIFTKTPGVRRRGVVSPPKFDPIPPDTGKYWFLVRCQISSKAADSDNSHRFAPGQVRLLGYASPNDEYPTDYYAKAISDDDDPSKQVKLEDGMIYAPDDAGEVDFVFEVPDDFAPLYLEYKLGARVELPESLESDTGDTTPASGSPSSQRSAVPPSSTADNDSTIAPTGRVSGARGRGRAVFSDKLPVPMSDFQQANFEQNRGALAAGHIWGDRDRQSTGPNALTRFDVPTDKRMLQLDVEILRAGSTLGKALSFAVTSLKNYQLRDKKGRAYPVVGQFAIANVDGTDIVEIEYFPSAVAATNRGGIRPFARIKDRHLKGRNYRLVYLFLVEPGAQIDRFTTGTGRRATDLSKLNLAAPR